MLSDCLSQPFVSCTHIKVQISTLFEQCHAKNVADKSYSNRSEVLGYRR